MSKWDKKTLNELSIRFEEFELKHKVPYMWLIYEIMAEMIKEIENE